VAAPKGDPGPPEQAQGNGPPAQRPAPQANARAHARSHATVGVQTQAGGHAKARGQGHATVGVEGSAGHGSGGHAKARTTSQGSAHSQAGKVTLCHATGSEKNPYVEITVSGNAEHAHRRHQDGRDIIPAAGDCPGGSAHSGGGGQGNENEHGKVTICHATGSETNPFVRITVSVNALKAHTAHQNGEDIVNPTGDCPSASIPTGVGNPPSGLLSPAGGQQGAESPASGVLGVSEERGAGPGGVQGANQGGGEEAGARNSTGTSLPFTGLGLGLLVGLGALLAVAGTHLRRRTA
jgi:hypothetical protein